ncbi:hypothetical protein ACFL2B_01695 [Patescibacteria group bacterium]
MNKLILILAFVFSLVGLAAVVGSGYFAVNHYVLADGISKPEPIEEIEIKVDTDQDGLTDQEEIDIHGTDPRKADTDQDGYSDKTEIDSGFDPLSPP